MFDIVDCRKFDACDACDEDDDDDDDDVIRLAFRCLAKYFFRIGSNLVGSGLLSWRASIKRQAHSLGGAPFVSMCALFQ